MKARSLPLLITLFAALSVCTADVAAPNGKQLLELRTYTFSSPEKQAAFEVFLRDAAVPALNRAGIRPVGVFKLRAADNPKLKLDADPLELYVLLPHASAASLTSLARKLDADSEYRAAGREVLDASKSDPAFVRFECSVLLPVDGVPKVEVPTESADRVLQLRIYESHSADRAQRKIEMFDGDELALFREVGLSPVFMGQALAGTRLPNLTYMLAFDNPEALKKAWEKFLAHPTWQRLRGDPKYKDTVSHITNLILRPVPGSQI